MLPDLAKYEAWFNTLPPSILLAAFVVILFYFLRAWPAFPNGLIKPVLFILGGFLYLGTSYGLTVIFMKGCVLSGLFLIFHRYLLCHAEKLLLGFLTARVPNDAVPQVANLLGATGDTAYLSKDTVKAEPKPTTESTP